MSEDILDYTGYFRRRFKSRKTDKPRLLTVAPFIDFVLLILFFMHMNGAYVLQPAVEIELPVSDFVSGVPFSAFVLTVTKSGELYLNDERTSWSDLASRLIAEQQSMGQRNLLIRADRSVSYEVLIDAYTIAIQAGIDRVAMATRETGTKPQLQP